MYLLYNYWCHISFEWRFFSKSKREIDLFRALFPFSTNSDGVGLNHYVEDYCQKQYILLEWTWHELSIAIKYCNHIRRKLTDVKIGGDEAWVVGDGDVRPLNILETSRFTWLLADPAQLHLRIEQRSHFLLQDLIGAVRQPQGHSTILGMNLYKLFGKFVSGL